MSTNKWIDKWYFGEDGKLLPCGDITGNIYYYNGVDDKEYEKETDNKFYDNNSVNFINEVFKYPLIQNENVEMSMGDMYLSGNLEVNDSFNYYFVYDSINEVMRVTLVNRAPENIIKYFKISKEDVEQLWGCIDETKMESPLGFSDENIDSIYLCKGYGNPELSKSITIDDKDTIYALYKRLMVLEKILRPNELGKLIGIYTTPVMIVKYSSGRKVLVTYNIEKDVLELGGLTFKISKDDAERLWMTF